MALFCQDDELCLSRWVAICDFECQLYDRRGPPRLGRDRSAPNLESADGCRASASASFRFGHTVQPCLCWHLEAGSILIICAEDILTRNLHIGHRTSAEVI
jgi:hypothetical protein